MLDEDDHVGYFQGNGALTQRFGCGDTAGWTPPTGCITWVRQLDVFSFVTRSDPPGDPITTLRTSLRLKRRLT